MKIQAFGVILRSSGGVSPPNFGLGKYIKFRYFDFQKKCHFARFLKTCISELSIDFRKQKKFVV